MQQIHQVYEFTHKSRHSIAMGLMRKIINDKPLNAWEHAWLNTYMENGFE